MNPSNDPLFDSRIAAWLEEDPHHAPGQVLETILAAVPSISQRHAMRVPWRFEMPAYARAAAAALFAVVLLGGALYLLGPRGNSPGASPTPTSSASPTPAGSAAATPATFTSSTFGMPISMTTPSNWSLLGEETDWYAVGRPLGGGPLVAVEVLTFDGSVYADTCDPEIGLLDPPIEGGAASLAQFVLAAPSLHAFSVPSVQIDGHTAVGIEDAMVSDERCVGGVVLWPMDSGDPYVIFEEEHKQLFFLDVDGSVVVVGVVTTNQGWLTYRPDAISVLETLRFQ